MGSNGSGGAAQRGKYKCGFCQHPDKSNHICPAKNLRDVMVGSTTRRTEHEWLSFWVKETGPTFELPDNPFSPSSSSVGGGGDPWSGGGGVITVSNMDHMVEKSSSTSTSSGESLDLHRSKCISAGSSTSMDSEKNV